MKRARISGVSYEESRRVWRREEALRGRKKNEGVSKPRRDARRRGRERETETANTIDFRVYNLLAIQVPRLDAREIAAVRLFGQLVQAVHDELLEAGIKVSIVVDGQ